MFCRKAVELIRELDRTDDGQLLPYNAEAVDEVLEECKEHQKKIIKIVGAISDKGEDPMDAEPKDSAAVHIHHSAIRRNKRCLIAYVHHRMQRIKKLRWEIGAVLPDEIQNKLSDRETEMFAAYSESLAKFMEDADIDLTVDMIPPKDPYIQVKALRSEVPMMVGSKVMHFARDSIHFVRRVDVEGLIREGMLKHIEF